MADASKQERIEELIRKSLLGEELINTQFHLFSARSVSPGRVTKPRVLCANNVLLAKSSKYFLDLLESGTITSDPSLVDIADSDVVPSSVQADDYGSDSDLDDEEPPVPVVAHAKTAQHQSTTPPAPRPQIDLTLIRDDGLSDSGSESVTSEMFVSDPEEDIGSDETLLANKDPSETSTEATVVSNHPLSEPATRLRSLGSRHILVKDTAFQTWYALVNYLYTGKVTLLPPRSSKMPMQPQRSSTSTGDEPKCSAKSMYRLARKVGLDDLRDEAFAFMQSNITENNVLQELSCSLVSRHPPLLEMLLDTLYANIASRPVVAGFPALARRIANKELPCGADIVIGLHTRISQEHHPLALMPPSQFKPCPPPCEGPHRAGQLGVGDKLDVSVPKELRMFGGTRVALHTPPPPFTGFGPVESPDRSSDQTCTTKDRVSVGGKQRVKK
ncbi:hypothetical protein PAXRUDRAFT_14935 [Paxillus rubicundulus Ve08.2h10]|uniref:BTB domain-containing protein n=1 Tax=Paxillus rubicundulus Ve08.2h10 TaxID=930991 RepID=A0A0D0CH71_9AGAM|nr:hypothetical protein PAXRUDRAFT_14935 [Paxillus rubicundulus Ve08.2h10]